MKTHCHFLALHFDRTAAFNVFIVSDIVSTVAIYFFGIEIHRISIAHAPVFLFC